MDGLGQPRLGLRQLQPGGFPPRVGGSLSASKSELVQPQSLSVPPPAVAPRVDRTLETPEVMLSSADVSDATVTGARTRGVAGKADSIKISQTIFFQPSQDGRLHP